MNEPQDPNPNPSIVPFDTAKADKHLPGILNEITVILIRFKLEIKNKQRMDPRKETFDVWILTIMNLIRRCAHNLLNYKEFRKGLIEVCALIILLLSFLEEKSHELNFNDQE